MTHSAFIEHSTSSRAWTAMAVSHSCDPFVPCISW